MNRSKKVREYCNQGTDSEETIVVQKGVECEIIQQLKALPKHIALIIIKLLPENLNGRNGRIP